MDSSAQTLGTLRAFRDSFHRCFTRRADALFELSDARLTAGSFPSPPHLSLAVVHRRGWGSLYAALSMGRMDGGALRGLLSGHPLLGGGTPSDPPIYAVDVSVWPRCDAEASPERGYYYHPSRHSAGQPIGAGWAYQLMVQLSFEHGSWVAPVDARRVKPAEDANEVAPGQVRALAQRLPEPETGPICVFDAGYDPVKLQRELEGCPARILVRLHSKCFLKSVAWWVRSLRRASRLRLRPRNGGLWRGLIRGAMPIKARVVHREGRASRRLLKCLF
jgi:hypothetical protein